MKFFFVLVASLIFFGIAVDCARYTDPVRVYGSFSKYQGGLVLKPHTSMDTIDCENRHPGSLFVLTLNGDESRTHLVYCDADGKTPRIYGIEQQPSFGFSASVVEIPELFQEGEVIDQAETSAIELRYAKWVEEANQACVDTYGEQARAGKATEFALFWNTGVGRSRDLRFTGSNPNFLAVTGDGAVIVNHEHKEYGYPILAVFADRRNGFGHEWDCDPNTLRCTQVAFSTYDSTDLESSDVTNFPDEYEPNAHVFCVASTAQKDGISVSHDKECLDVSGDLEQLQSNADLMSRYYAGWVEAPSAIPGWYDDHSNLDFNFIHGVDNSADFSGNFNYELEMSTGSSREPWYRNKQYGHTLTLNYAYSINEDCRKAPIYNCTDYNYIYNFESPYSQFFGYDILDADPYFRISYESFDSSCCPGGVWELGIDRPLNNTGGFNSVDPDLEFNHVDINLNTWTKLDTFNNEPLIRRTDRSFDRVRYRINGHVSLRCTSQRTPPLRKQERCGNVNLHLQVRAKPFEGAKILHKTCATHETYTNDKLCNNVIPTDENTDDWNCESHNFGA